MKKSASVDHSTMHEMNMALILDTLRLQTPVSRAGLAARTGLNKATVSSMVKELVNHQFVREIGADAGPTDIGRPAINLELNPDAGYIIGAEIGGDFVSVIVTNFACEIVARRYQNTQHLKTQEAILDCVFTLLRDSYNEVLRAKRRLLGMGIGVPGLVDMVTGTLLFAPNLGWCDVPLKALLQAEFDTEIWVGNEANLAAMGESYFGAGQHSDLLVFVSSGVGLGGGIVLDNHLLAGAVGFAGEFGHMTVAPDGPRCNCGNVGCWETMATQRALFRTIREAAAAGRATLLTEMTRGNLDELTVSLVEQAARNRDAVAAEALAEVGRWLGIGIANLINAINPQCVVFGGPLSLAHAFLLPAVKAEVARRALSWSRASAEIVLAAHGADAAAMGAVATVHHAIVSQPKTWLVRP